MKRESKKTLLCDIIVLLVSLLIFGTPLYFLLINSFKDTVESSMLTISWPTKFDIGSNYLSALSAQDYMIVRAFLNSVIITLFSIITIVVVCSMAGYVIQRRKDKFTKIVNNLILAGLMIPPAILPTIWVMQGLHIYKTLLGMVLIELALGIPFNVMLYRGYVSSIPSALEEAALIDGCNRKQIFFKIIFPLLKPVTSTVIILSSVSIFNDFVNPLYFLPGTKNATIQLTLYNFMGKFSDSYNILFADIVIITLPLLILFIVFNKKIIDGMVAGSVKG